jgi:F-type H+-transporting ATPase subunit alpha
MEKQVVIIYAGSNGYLDKLPVATLADYESELYSYIESNDPSIFSDIDKEKMFTDAIKEKLNKVLTSFGDTFKASKGLN